MPEGYRTVAAAWLEEISGLAARLWSFVLLAITLAGICSPDHTQRMKYEGISHGQFAWIRNDLIGVINGGMQRDTPGLMPNYAFAMFACGLRVVAVTVKNGCAVVCH
jgi:hypothetical protein